MRTEHARSQPKTPCMSLASSTVRAINLFRILNCRFHMNEQEVAKIRHRMANTCYEVKFDPNILWLASNVLHKWEHMNAFGEVHK